MSFARVLLFLSLLLVLAGCGSTQVAPKRPPDPKVESRPPKPSAGVFWQTGHWAWKEDPGIFYWVAGGWVAERDGYMWFPGHWAPSGEGESRKWTWVEDRWDKRIELGDLDRR